ncbi:hypothetical protein CAPTEDRAFT_223079 [Capitella teleta]|uniref:GH10 domain-containing protein n=1 Tax=Capitella teleta TaxID=283909 RepID=R7TXS5_CAPTE|nr:hypothetical protein CAPTEDRAFT_223079 [Capitella teleta]|eukprot:ELT98723.1 hypothetical protein CAPTEDRAFT_223079 [Capitella teleta]
MKSLSALVLCVVLVNEAMGASNLLVNSNFEGDFKGNWYCHGCTLTRIKGGVGGSYAAQVTKRTSRLATLRQDVAVSGGGNMHFKTQVKLLNAIDNVKGHCVESYAYITRKSGSGSMTRFGRMFNIFPSSGWVEIGGDFEVPTDVAKVTVVVVNDNQRLNYVADNAELVKLPASHYWKNAANTRINQFRKGSITVKYDLSSKYDPRKVEVKVSQTRHDFGFGFAVKAPRMYSTSAVDKNYQKFIYSLSNTVTITNALKWRFMESVEGKPSFYVVDKAMEQIKAHNVSVRGHCLAWAKTDRIPSWLSGKSPSQVQAHVQRRVKYLSQHYKGQFSQYDVNNENLHGFWYESKTSDVSFTENMIKWMHNQDPNVELCMNDYNVVAKGMFTAAYKRQAKLAIDRNVPVSCLGVQAHYDGKTLPNPAATLKRLDELASTGLKIWITEMDFKAKDMAMRAQGYDDNLRLFFSHPAVAGIIMWAPWNLDNGNKPCALVEGNNFVYNQAGTRVKNLIKYGWMTRQSLVPTSRTQSISFPGFYGGYEVKVSYAGKVVSTGNFYIAKGKTASYTVRLT